MTMSPFNAGDAGSGTYYMMNYTFNIYLVSGNVNTVFDVKPVINLKSSVGVTLKGTGEPGTSTNPYIVVTN